MTTDGQMSLGQLRGQKRHHPYPLEVLAGSSARGGVDSPICGSRLTANRPLARAPTLTMTMTTRPRYLPSANPFTATATTAMTSTSHFCSYTLAAAVMSRSPILRPSTSPNAPPRCSSQRPPTRRRPPLLLSHHVPSPPSTEETRRAATRCRLPVPRPALT
ncbi:hypothetical protein BKA93DRAFT_361437 [Sparassis latifolia]